MKIKEGYVLREAANQFEVVPKGEELFNLKAIITLNPSGKFIWDKMQQEVDVRDLVEFMLKKYDISEVRAHQDILEFIEILQSKNLIDFYGRQNSFY